MAGSLPASSEKDVLFFQDDVLAPHLKSIVTSLTSSTRSSQDKGPGSFDILISNPPYISPTEFASTTARSVRNWEPKLALVPPAITPTLKSGHVDDDEVEHGDLFYHTILTHARDVKAKVVVMEVGGKEQARRVVKIIDGFEQSMWVGREIWRDWPDGPDGETVGVDAVSSGQSGREHLRLKGTGEERVVVCWTEEGGRRWVRPK
jgi:hypothetical protein